LGIKTTPEFGKQDIRTTLGKIVRHLKEALNENTWDLGELLSFSLDTRLRHHAEVEEKSESPLEESSYKAQGQAKDKQKQRKATHHYRTLSFIRE
jgi:hypothetical protein